MNKLVCLLYYLQIFARQCSKRGGSLEVIFHQQRQNFFNIASFDIVILLFLKSTHAKLYSVLVMKGDHRRCQPASEGESRDSCQRHIFNFSLEMVTIQPFNLVIGFVFS